MSLHIRTTQSDELLIEQIRLALSVGQTLVHKWHVLRLALAFALHFPKVEAEQTDEQDLSTTDYDLQQVTGLGKSAPADLTPSLEAAFANDEGQDSEPFHRRLEAEIRRGFRLIRSMWAPGEDLWPVIARVFVPDYIAPVATLSSSALAASLRKLKVRVDAVHEVGPRMTGYKTSEIAAPLDAVRLAILSQSKNAASRPIDISIGASGTLVSVARPPTAWGRVALTGLHNEDASSQNTVALGLLPQGGIFSLARRSRLDIYAAEGFHRRAILRLLASQLGETPHIAIAGADSSLWNEAAIVNLILPEDPTTIAVLADRARDDIVILDVTSSVQNLLPRGTGIWRIFGPREWPTSAPKNIVAFFGYLPTQTREEASAQGLDVQDIGTGRDMIIASPTEGTRWYARVHLPDRFLAGWRI